MAVTGDDAKRLEAIANDDEIQDGDFWKVPIRSSKLSFCGSDVESSSFLPIPT